MPRILLIGQGGTTETALTSLLGCFEVVGVVRQADPDDPVARLALASGVKLYLDTSMTGVERLVAELKPDAVVVSSYDRILRAPLLAQCPFVNVHYAPLPEYRGRATVNWALINGETHAAISIHELVPQLDGGEILYQRLVPITATDTVATLYARLNELQREALGPTVARFLAGEHGRAQDHARATYGCTRLPEDGEIDWSWPTRKIDALVRAVVSPFPGAFTYLRGDRLRVWRTVPVAQAPTYVGRIPGRVVAVSKAHGWVDVLTGDGILRLLEIQADTGERVTAASLVPSVKMTLGFRASAMLDRVRELESRLVELADVVTMLTLERGRASTGGEDHDRGQTDPHHRRRRPDWVAHRGSARRRTAI